MVFVICFGPIAAWLCIIAYAVCRAGHDADELEALDVQRARAQRQTEHRAKAHSARLHPRSTAPFPARRRSY